MALNCPVYYLTPMGCQMFGVFPPNQAIWTTGIQLSSPE